MSSIIWDGDAFHGISVVGRGVFTHENERTTSGYQPYTTYAGQCRDGFACGLGVASHYNGYMYYAPRLGGVAWSGGSKIFAEHGPDGRCDGRNLERDVNGHTVYRLFERGKLTHSARVRANGRTRSTTRCLYNREGCARDDPRLLALIAQVAPVEVRPAAPALNHHTSPTRHQVIFRWICRLGLPPQALATAMATEVHPHAARRGPWPRDATQRQQSHCTARPRSTTHPRTDLP
jgi:hypothetical protein